jgi:hypothetical protein
MSQLFQDSLVPWEKTAGCDANTSNAKSVESAPEPMSSVGRIASLLIFPFRAISRLFTVFGVAKEFRRVVISGERITTYYHYSPFTLADSDNK